MSNTYYYAVGAIIKELDCEGVTTENCLFLNEEGDFTDLGLGAAVVHQCEETALQLAHSVYGRVIKVHSEFVDSLDIKIKN